ncbi:hypothetical protein B0H13DRAFT_1917126 [Mycena leptocephala]|nr:hypothetical protein B0H13DRAFT_1917126 [Mycena leptocephala]
MLAPTPLFTRIALRSDFNMDWAPIVDTVRGSVSPYPSLRVSWCAFHNFPMSRLRAPVSHEALELGWNVSVRVMGAWIHGKGWATGMYRYSHRVYSTISEEESVVRGLMRGWNEAGISDQITTNPPFCIGVHYANDMLIGSTLGYPMMAVDHSNFLEMIRLFDFGAKAKAKPEVNSWPGLRFRQAKAKYRTNLPPKAMVTVRSRVGS